MVPIRNTLNNPMQRRWRIRPSLLLVPVDSWPKVPVLTFACLEEESETMGEWSRGFVF